LTRAWTVISISTPGRFKRTIQDSTTGRNRAPTAEEAAELNLKKMPDRSSLQLVTYAELPSLKARLEKNGRKVEDAFPENQAPAPTAAKAEAPQ
jgi:hypothetical protein